MVKAIDNKDEVLAETVENLEKAVDRILAVEKDLAKLTAQLQQKFGDADFGTPKPFMGKRS